MTANSAVPESRPILVICGPTASGKSEVAHALAKNAPLEIVSADSRQLVRHLNIGTAKPTLQERQEVPYHLIDMIEPGERYSAFRYIGDATRVINEILKRGHQPIVVGGTGLYIRALMEGVVEIEQGDMEVRERLEAEMESLGPEAMYDQLKQIDPLEASKTHPNNKIRVIRALEIYYLTGKSKSEVTATGTYRKGHFNFECHSILPDRDELYERINVRVDRMMEQGLFQEVELLVQQGLEDRIRKANIIGYNELLDYIDDRIGLDEAVSTIKQNTRRYAKRQLTWFRHQSDCKNYTGPVDVLKAVGID